ncbi:uncharacterized protein PG998_004979 [Apiospora kogelbergensis]|uniref:uncharacterized protein n=1 Tax=Apiospora kogelbergensis TaxID=1337665 RepID=UPI00312D1994
MPLPSGDLPSGSCTYYTGVTSPFTANGATVATITFPAAVTPSTIRCPPDDEIIFATPSTTIYTDCMTPTTITIGLPQWPRIAVGPNVQLTYDSEPTSCSTTQTASICTGTTVFTVKSDRTTMATISTTTERPDCETISGCSATRNRTIIGRRVAAFDDDGHGHAHPRPLHRREEHENRPAIVYPIDSRDKARTSQIVAVLRSAELEFREVRSDFLAGGYTAFIWVANLTSNP